MFFWGSPHCGQHGDIAKGESDACWVSQGAQHMGYLGCITGAKPDMGKCVLGCSCRLSTSLFIFCLDDLRIDLIRVLNYCIIISSFMFVHGSVYILVPPSWVHKYL